MMDTSVPGLIGKKSDGKELDDEDIHTFVTKVVNKDIHESQIGAMLMAMHLKGLSRRETSVLTREMTNTGATLSWPREWDNLLVDKHSTGGVGDKVSLPLAPALAALGLKVPMISGRGLGHTGGTLDKLESMSGYNVKLSQDEMRRQLDTVGCFIAGQTDDVCPADKKLYAIRDVTATVSNIGLITASIVSKKAAERTSTLILDVKLGSGAFLSDHEDAVKLAKSMVDCSRDMGMKTAALLTDMNSPIGNMIGNALEVVESVQCLQGRGPRDLHDLVVDTGGHALYTNGNVTSVQEGCDKIRDVIANGQALSKFREMIKAQGVDRQLADDLCDASKDARESLPRTAMRRELTCKASGYIHGIDSMSVAKTTHKLGGGRNKPGEKLNWAVGVELLAHIGDKVAEGQPWVVVHYADDKSFNGILRMLEEAIDIKDTPCVRKPRLLQVIT